MPHGVEMVGALKNVATIYRGSDPSTRIAHDEIHVPLHRLQTRCDRATDVARTEPGRPGLSAPAAYKR